MNIPEDLRAEASAAQSVAAFDPSTRVRLVAGPGAGKSAVIKRRVLWLLRDRGVPPLALKIVSFTNASADDLRADIHQLLRNEGLGDLVPEVQVSTLHSLALAVLRAAGRLSTYAVDPRVLDQWETKNIFDPEFGAYSGEASTTRQQQVRRDHEAFWSTGNFDPAGYPMPDPPISEAERESYLRFYTGRSTLYGCVLPSEINRQCLEYLRSAPADFLPIQLEHLIVDEYQDLNPVDLELVGEMAARGASLYVAGDDDQSIYFFRYALPRGIQRFADQGGGDHRLRHCFRCGEGILGPALSLLAAYATEERIPKDYVAVPSQANPAVNAQTLRWTFRGPRREADAIAESCRELIECGIPAGRIAILLSTTRDGIEQAICESLTAVAVPFEPATASRFCDTNTGRCLAAALRIIASDEDYVALRVLVGVRRGVGPGIGNEIARACTLANMTYRDVLDGGVERTDASARARRVIEATGAQLEELQGLSAESTLAEGSDALLSIVRDSLGEEARIEAVDWLSGLGEDFTLAEVLLAATAASENAYRRVLAEAQVRLGREPDEPLEEPDCVRILTLHRSKGLTVDVAFIPGLEEGLLPSSQAQPFPGLLAEQARLLYVGLTRARLAAVASYSSFRNFRGELQQRTPSRFLDRLGRFETREGGLTAAELDSIRVAADALATAQQ